MERHHIFRFLFVRVLTTTLLFGGLGVLGQQNDLREIPIFINDTSFSGIGPKWNS
jgi:hypothetical protein